MSRSILQIIRISETWGNLGRYWPQFAERQQETLVEKETQCQTLFQGRGKETDPGEE